MATHLNLNRGRLKIHRKFLQADRAALETPTHGLRKTDILGVVGRTHRLLDSEPFETTTTADDEESSESLATPCCLLRRLCASRIRTSQNMTEVRRELVLGR